MAADQLSESVVIWETVENNNLTPHRASIVVSDSVQHTVMVCKQYFIHSVVLLTAAILLTAMSKTNMAR